MKLQTTGWWLTFSPSISICSKHLHPKNGCASPKHLLPPSFETETKKIPLLKCERIWLQPSYRSNKTPENSISLKMTPKNTQCTPDGGFFSTQLSNRKGIPNNWYWHAWLVEVQESFFPKDVSSQGSSEDCWRISHHTYPTHIQHILHIPHISISNVSTTHIPHISSTLHISHTYPFQTYPTHTYPISTYPCNAYPFKRL